MVALQLLLLCGLLSGGLVPAAAVATAAAGLTDADSSLALLMLSSFCMRVRGLTDRTACCGRLLPPSFAHLHQVHGSVPGWLPVRPLMGCLPLFLLSILDLALNAGWQVL